MSARYPGVTMRSVVVVALLALAPEVQAGWTISNVNFLGKVACGLKQLHPRSQCKMDIKCDPNAKYRQVDGSCNNLDHPGWGKSFQPFDRLIAPAYHDGYWFPRTVGVDGFPLPSPRVVSTKLHVLDSEQTQLRKISNMFVTWGQFLDHDITRTPMLKDEDGKDFDCCNGGQLIHGPFPYRGGPCFSIAIPFFDAFLKRRCMSFSRSRPAPRNKTCGKSFKEQLSEVTAFVDASQMYGSTKEEQKNIRRYSAGGNISAIAQCDVQEAHQEKGRSRKDRKREKTKDRHFRRFLRQALGYWGPILFPETPRDCKNCTCQLRMFNSNFLPTNNDTSRCFVDEKMPVCFKSGDVRVNEHPGLTSLHTVFLRHHNSLCSRLAKINPHWDDDRLFQEARKIVAAEMQRITFGEWLPLLLGPKVMSFFELGLDVPFEHRKEANPTILNSFATAAFRYGHSQIPTLWTLGPRKVNLADMFKRPQLLGGDGLPQIVVGMITDRAQKADFRFSDGVANHLFEDRTRADRPPLDLVSLNIQRGRDHGLPSYKNYLNICKRLMARPKLLPKVAKRMMQIYRSLFNVDLFSGGVSEEGFAGAQVGATFACIIGLQFHRIKFGDRFWHQTSDQNIGFTGEQQREIEKVSLSQVLCDATSVGSYPKNAFNVPSYRNPVWDCSHFPIDLSKWADV